MATSPTETTIDAELNHLNIDSLEKGVSVPMITIFIASVIGTALIFLLLTLTAFFKDTLCFKRKELDSFKEDEEKDSVTGPVSKPNNISSEDEESRPSIFDIFEITQV